MIMEVYETSAGHRYPMGATPDETGVNFCIFSRHATSVVLLLYKKADSVKPMQEIELRADENRTFFFWHVYVKGLTAPICYTWKVDGPDDVAVSGHRFDKNRELLDPWARSISTVFWDRQENRKGKSGRSSAMRALVCPRGEYDWQGDQPLQRPPEQEIIYELHVGGFTRNKNSKVGNPGTFNGLIAKIPYLKELGITCVELLPIMAFDEQDVPDSVAKIGLSNYWGYSTHSFFSPHPGYCSSPLPGERGRELKDMVKALHRAGIKVILDVVYNHTAEGGHDGPVINFKGLDNRIFYHLDEENLKHYKNFSGCGNTLNCNHPLVASFILDSLEYWVREYHIDGFRFDLASILARGEDGKPMYHAPVVWSIEFSEPLVATTLIAEAWDAGGLYQVGGFPGLRWAEWNGRYRDLIRQFVRGDKGLIAELATRLSGSSDLYAPSGKLPINTINFITCHDGFTLADLVSYNTKHNLANGEENRDGDNHNYSWNCGVEGPTKKKAVLELRWRQVKNYMAILLLSQGVPMILSGDEVLRSQKGNNNCWCQDNELGWFDWNLVEQHKEMFRFTREMIRFRKRHPCLQRGRFLNGNTITRSGLTDISWHGKELTEPDWFDSQGAVLAFTLGGVGKEEEDLHVVLNMSEKLITVELPQLPQNSKRTWHQAISTAAKAPGDIRAPERQHPVKTEKIKAAARSVRVFESR